MVMLSDREIERWYLGLPFETTGNNGKGRRERDSGDPLVVVDFPTMTEEDIERLCLGFPFKAA
jgi:hypothetical protein